MKRSFLFLQGPLGPFFKRLGHCLMKEGLHVVRVNFNGGDIFDWSGPETIILREKAKDWPDFLAELIHKNETTDLITYGDCRPQLRTGTKIARSMGVRCHVFEQGYIRPDLITLEDFGVNGNSLLPKSPEWYVDLARKLPSETRAKPTGFSMRKMMRYSIPYNIAKFTAQPFFACFRNHRPYSERIAVSRWVLKTLRMKSQSERDQEFQRKFLASGRKFFLFCLQLGCDYQIRFHSPFADINSAIINVLTSFSRHLPAGIDLLLKSHPMELWPSELEAFTLNLARQMGIENRVFFTSGGSLPAYVKASLGMITVNSTAGMASLDHRRPTIALGKAIYDIPGVTYVGGLDSFWNDPAPPDSDLYSAFRRVLIHKTQINGNFYTRKGIELAAPKAIQRLLGREDI
ncbi:MAG: capsular biosynthesis protein [Syntrophobacteraceae bacterium]